jgi:hypothetical protein
MCRAFIDHGPENGPELNKRHWRLVGSFRPPKVVRSHCWRRHGLDGASLGACRRHRRPCSPWLACIGKDRLSPIPYLSLSPTLISQLARHWDRCPYFTMADNSAASKMGLYEPLLPPPFQVSDTHRGAYALLAAEIMIVIAGLAVCVKLQMAASTFRKLRLNDLALLVALVQAPKTHPSSSTDLSRSLHWAIRSQYVRACGMGLVLLPVR